MFRSSEFRHTVLFLFRRLPDKYELANPKTLLKISSHFPTKFSISLSKQKSTNKRRIYPQIIIVFGNAFKFFKRKGFYRIGISAVGKACLKSRHSKTEKSGFGKGMKRCPKFSFVGIFGDSNRKNSAQKPKKKLRTFRAV